MIEYFVTSYINDQMNPDPDQKKNVMTSSQSFSQTWSNMSPNRILGIIVSLIIAIAAAYLAYECNAYESMPMRIFSTIIAFTFSGIYLIYYFIRYTVLGSNCHVVPVGAVKIRRTKVGRSRAKVGRSRR
jgi:uncharacterized protein YacL